MFNLFRKQLTASDLGKMGAAARLSKEKAKVRAKCDELREKMGLEPARWPE